MIATTDRPSWVPFLRRVILLFGLPFSLNSDELNTCKVCDHKLFQFLFRCFPSSVLLLLSFKKVRLGKQL